MYRLYTLKRISGESEMWPNMVDTQEGASPASRALLAKLCRVWYMVRRRSPALASVGYQTHSRIWLTFKAPRFVR